ncbi:hypothetical protein ID866_11020 [Astraeus odoratus]|nr:hypothetical protein ID866_11020 [Astraeus odoratus]
MHINISPAIAHDAAFEWFKKYTQQELNTATTYQQINYKLHASHLPFDEDKWDALVHIVLMEGMHGMECIMAAQNLVKSDALVKSTTRNPPLQEPSTGDSAISSTTDLLLQDPSAWLLVMEWAKRQADACPLSINQLEKFGDHFHYEEWRDIFNAVFNTSEDGILSEVSTAECCKGKGKSKSKSDSE